MGSLAETPHFAFGTKRHRARSFSGRSYSDSESLLQKRERYKVGSVLRFHSSSQGAGGHSEEGVGMFQLLRFFRLSGALEAVSYIVLLGIAMPLKYFYDKPVFVRWTGSFHGAFFVLFCIAVVFTAYRKKWSLRTTGMAFLSAFIPLGPFLFEKYFLDKNNAELTRTTD